MANPTLTFEQAVPYMRRGFIVRVHGADEWEGAQLREEQGKFELSRGDSNWNVVPGNMPLLELTYDVYDQKRQPDNDAAKLQRAEPLAPYVPGQSVRIVDGNERVTVRRIDEVGRVYAYRNDNPDGPDEVFLREQLKPDDSQVGGGNSPAQIDPSTNADSVNSATSGNTDGSSFGINAGQVEQAKDGPIENTDEHRVDAGVESNTHADVPVSDVPEDASKVVDGEPAGADNDPDEHEHKKKKKSRW